MHVIVYVNLLSVAGMTVRAYPKQVHVHSSKWTAEDFNVCVNLVSKARQHGVYEAVMERVRQQHLPPGVHSVEHWAAVWSPSESMRTRRHTAYHNIAFGRSEDLKGYRAYMFSHFESGSARFRDLVLYMKAAGVNSDDGIKIPGTSINRIDNFILENCGNVRSEPHPFGQGRIKMQGQFGP